MRKLFADLKAATSDPYHSQEARERAIYEAAREIYLILSESYHEAENWPDVIACPEIELYLSENERDSTQRVDSLLSYAADNGLLSSECSSSLQVP